MIKEAGAPRRPPLGTSQWPLTFTRDVVFSSPSTAGAIVTGRSCNGRTTWKTADGRTFGDWEQQGLGTVVGEPALFT